MQETFATERTNPLAEHPLLGTNRRLEKIEQSLTAIARQLGHLALKPRQRRVGAIEEKLAELDSLLTPLLAKAQDNARSNADVRQVRLDSRFRHIHDVMDELVTLAKSPLI